MLQDVAVCDVTRKYQGALGRILLSSSSGGTRPLPVTNVANEESRYPARSSTVSVQAALSRS